MKILLAHKNCLVGGVEIVLASLAPALRARGHQCDFFFFERGPMAEQLPPGFAVHFGDLADCLRLVSAGRYDVVHVNSYDWLFGISAVRDLGARLLVMAQGANGINPGWTSQTCDAFTTCSGWLARRQKALTDVEPRVVPNGVDVGLFKPAEGVGGVGPPIVAWVGRGIDGVKQLGRFAEVAPLLHRAGLRVRLAEPYGPAAVEKALGADVSALRGVAEFWGDVPKEKMPGFYQEVAASGGCVVSTSAVEGLGIAMLEAQACGCLAIGPDVPGINESVCPARGGVLYDAGLDARRLADVILGALSAPDSASRRRAAVQYVCENFALEAMVEGYLRAYETAVNAGPKKRPPAFGLTGPLSPVLHWRDYVAHRWAPGRCHYEASRRLAEQGDWATASVAARAALRMAPTIFVRPGRLAHLLKAWRKGAAQRRAGGVTLGRHEGAPGSSPGAGS